MGMYEGLCGVDLIAPIIRRLKSGKLWINELGRIEERFEQDWESPWVHTKLLPDRNCGLWSSIMFQIYRVIPKGCFDCWKVAFRPKTLREVMQVKRLQEAMAEKGHCSKVGMEARSYTGKLGGWGAFWYVPLASSLEGAREYRKVVAETVQKIIPGAKVGLKRACTEMELTAGPTDKWEYQEGWEAKEVLVKSACEPFPVILNQPKLIQVHVMRTWIEWAAQHGDETYLEYVDKPFFPEAITYEGSIHRNEDYPKLRDYEKETSDECNNQRKCPCRSTEKATEVPGLALVEPRGDGSGPRVLEAVDRVGPGAEGDVGLGE